MQYSIAEKLSYTPYHFQHVLRIFKLSNIGFDHAKVHTLFLYTSFNFSCFLSWSKWQ